MRVLIVAYYFPPLGLSGVQRITKFVKYLPEFGIEPIVLTTNPGSYFAYDESLLQDLERPGITIVRTSSVDPTRLFGTRKTVRLPDENARQTLSRLSQLVFIPDNKIGWFPSATHVGNELVAKHKIDAVVSTAPPYSAHLIGRKIARKHNLPLIADYRDAWVDNPRHEYPTSFHKKINQRLEKRVLESSAAVVAINDRIAGAMRRRYPDLVESKIHVVKQGFDSSDLIAASDAKPTVCEFLYAGVFYDTQSPDTFLRGFADFLDRSPSLRSRVRARFVGLFPKYAIDLIVELSLQDNVVLDGYLPHTAATAKLMQASVLWMTIGDGPGADQISTGKLYEYFGTRKPILALVPEGAARDDLLRYAGSTIVQPNDVEGVAAGIDKLVDLWQNGQLPTAAYEDVSEYDRQTLTGDLAGIIKKAVAASTKRISGHAKA